MSLANLCSDINENTVEELYKIAIKNNVWFNKRKVLAVKCYHTSNATEFIIYMPHRVIRIIYYDSNIVVVVK